MLSKIVVSILIVLSICLVICVSGYILYKMGDARSVEEGISLSCASIADAIVGLFHFLSKISRPLCRFLYEAIYEGWTGHDLPEKLIKTELMLSNAEALELVQKFKNSPYIVPSLFNYIRNVQGVLSLDIKAVGLALRYQSFGRKDICDMAENIIQNFYMESRETSVRIFIKVASPTRLYFAIPLNMEAEKYLEKQV